MELDPTLRIVYVKRGTVPEVGAVWCFMHAVQRMADWPAGSPMDAKLTRGTFTCVDCLEEDAAPLPS